MPQAGKVIVRIIPWGFRIAEWAVVATLYLYLFIEEDLEGDYTSVAHASLFGVFFFGTINDIDLYHDPVYKTSAGEDDWDREVTIARFAKTRALALALFVTSSLATVMQARRWHKDAGNNLFHQMSLVALPLVTGASLLRMYSFFLKSRMPGSTRYAPMAQRQSRSNDVPLSARPPTNRTARAGTLASSTRVLV